MICEGAHAAFAQNHLVVAFRKNVLSRHEKLFERGRHTALQQDRLARASGPAQEREVLYVARADLDAVSEFFHQVECFNIDGLGYDAKSSFVAGVGKVSQTLFAQALKSIWRGAGFISSAPQQVCAGGLDGASGSQNLFAALHRAGARAECELGSADWNASDLNHGIVRLHFATDQLIE